MKAVLSTTILAVTLFASGCQKKTEPSKKKNQEQPTIGPAGMRPAPARKAPKRRAAAKQAGPRLVQVWSTGGLKVPESVLNDPTRKVLYVSCINGKPTEKNGKGFIARLSPAGKILTLEWAKGLNAPKGMGLAGDTLWVTDIDRLHAIDVKTGKVTKTIDVPAAKFLNDIAIGPKGRVFVSDMVTGKVHVRKGDKLPIFADLKPLQGANGMLLHDGHLRVGTKTGIAQVSLEDGKATILVPVKGFGMIDGLKAYAKDAWLMSNWAGRTQLVRKDGTVTVLQDTTAQKIQSADFEYIAATKTLLIPTFFNNHVVAYRIEP